MTINAFTIRNFKPEAYPSVPHMSLGTINDRIGLQLQALRKENRARLCDVGDILGVSMQQIQKYENGLNRISASKLYVLSKYYDIPTTRFFDRLPKGDIRILLD